MNRRVGIAKNWVLNKSNVGFFDMTTKVFSVTCAVRAKKYITKITEEKDFLLVSLKDYDKPLFFPKSMPIRSLYQCISETYNQNDWHYYEVDETKVGMNDTVVDCGAAEGMFAFSVIDRCKKVYAIEPLPAFIDSMKNTFSENNKFELIQNALSDSAGTAYMNEQDISSSVSDQGTLQVALQTIDNLFYEKNIDVHYLKADLEGFEIMMMKGAEKTIKKNKPKIAITTYHVADHAKVLESMLRSYRDDYKFKVKGIEDRWGSPVMLHAW